MNNIHIMWPWELLYVHRPAHVMSTQGLSCVFALVDLTTEDDNFKAWPNPCFTMPEAGSHMLSFPSCKRDDIWTDYNDYINLYIYIYIYHMRIYIYMFIYVHVYMTTQTLKSMNPWVRCTHTHIHTHTPSHEPTSTQMLGHTHTDKVWQRHRSREVKPDEDWWRLNGS